MRMPTKATVYTSESKNVRIAYPATMTWDESLFAVFDDLESQAEDAYAREREMELVDRSRAEYAEVTLAARLMASARGDGTEVAIEVTGVGAVRGRVDRVGAGWVLLRGERSDWLLCTAAIGSVDGASERAVPEVAWPVGSRLGLGSALRRLADAGERCILHRVDGGTHDGVVRRAGADFVELLSGEPVRPVLVAYASLAAVQSRGRG